MIYVLRLSQTTILNLNKDYHKNRSYFYAEVCWLQENKYIWTDRGIRKEMSNKKNPTQVNFQCYNLRYKFFHNIFFIFSSNYNERYRHIKFHIKRSYKTLFAIIKHKNIHALLIFSLICGIFACFFYVHAVCFSFSLAGRFHVYLISLELYKRAFWFNFKNKNRCSRKVKQPLRC